MSVTLSQLRTLAYGVMREEEDSSAYPYALVDMFLDATQLDFCSGLLIDPLTKEPIRKGKLPFLNVDKFYSNVQSTTLTTATTVGATTLTVGSTSGYTTTSGEMVGIIGGNTFTYTGKTSTTFTGVSGIQYAFPAGTQVSQVFVLPTNYMSPIQVIYNGQFKLECKNYDEVYEDLNAMKGNYNRVENGSQPFTTTYRTAPFYTIKDNTYLIVWNLDSTGPAIHLRYQKKPTEFTTTSTTATIDNDTYAKTILSSFTASEVLSFRGEEMRAKQIISDNVTRRVRAAYDYYNSTGFEDINGVRVQSDKSGRRLNI